jgi:hypothetical protein
MPKVRKLSKAEVQRLEGRQLPQKPEPQPAIAPQKSRLDDAYPYVAGWVDGGGWIELGQDEYSRSFIRILDIGGMLWEGPTRYTSLDALLREAEAALIELKEGGEL